MRKFLVALFAVALTMPALAGHKEGHSKDEAAIRKVAKSHDEAWNKGDIKGRMAAFADDATIINPMGQKATGKAEIEKLFGMEAATVAKGTKHHLKITSFRWITDDAVAFDCDITISGMKGPDGKTMKPMMAHGYFLVMKKDGKWLVQDARPYVYMAPPPAPAAMEKKEEKKGEKKK